MRESDVLMLAVGQGTGRWWLAAVFIASLPTTIAQVLVAMGRNDDPWWLVMDPKTQTGKNAAAAAHIFGSLFLLIGAIVSS